MELKEKIEEFLEKHLADSPHFLVEVEQKGTERFPKLSVFLDGDKGIDINTCAKVSRSLGVYIDENEIITTPYGLDVSSPGIDRPLKHHRQYVANIGRKLRVWDMEGNKIDGILKEVNDGRFTLEVTKGKNVDFIAYEVDQVDKVKVMISI